ncbi:polysialyltransferase family glycosyltransferase [Streptomyces flavovirens]
MTTRILLASSLAGTVTLAAALDAGLLPRADRTVLLLFDGASVPEAVPGTAESSGFERLRTRFDEVFSWNDAVAPFHPAGWQPRADDVPLWERHFRRAWGLGDDGVELVLESPHAGPSQALAQVFTGVPVDVYADGPGCYGPTNGKVPPLTGTRVRRLFHPDLVPGLRPLLLAEYGAEPRAVPAGAIGAVVAELAGAPVDLPDVEAPALLLGQALAASGLLSPAEERELRLEMVRGAAALGHTRLVFAPHPWDPAGNGAALTAEAARLGVGLTVLDASVPVAAEVLFRRLRPALVVGCSSAALLTAAAFHQLPVATAGTGTLLERLTPYEHEERIPVTLVDALLPRLDDASALAGRTGRAAEEEVSGLVSAVGYAMQPKTGRDLRPAAERYLAAHLDGHTWRYFKRRRLAALALPGVVPARLAFLRRNTAVRRVARRARALRDRARR